MRDKTYRRLQTTKAKHKAAHILKRWWDWTQEEITDRDVGRMANVHCKPCSCYMCGNPRRWFKDLSIQERRFNGTE